MDNSPPPDTPSSDLTNGVPGSAAPRVVIVGASARSAAFSALRAGFQPVCFDQFADVDLQAFAEAEVVGDYPEGIVKKLAAADDLPVVYTGAMENHPEVLGRIAATQPLLGNDESTISAVRDPVRVREILSGVHVPCLDVCSADSPPPADGEWLLKPLRSAAGRGVCVWDEAAAESPTLEEPHYFQRKAEGQTISAVYIASQDPLQVRYVGLTRQLVGLAELNAPPFAWCGSIGPVALETRGEILARRTGTVLAHQFGLQGLYGCDFIVNEAGEPLLTEVNPRYTGSVEVLEVLCGTALFEDHCRATGWDVPEGLDVRPSVVPSEAIVGKAILYSDRDLVAPDTSAWPHTTPWEPMPGFADLPQTGSVIGQGNPVCTIFAIATSFDDCEAQLLQSAASVRAVLADCPAP